MHTILQDVIYAVRQLRRSPGFTILAIAVMALGIGANSAVFSVVNAVLLRPLRFTDPDRIVRLSTLWLKSGHHGQVSAPDFQDWHDQSGDFSAMGSYSNYENAVRVGAAAEYAGICSASSEFFDALGVKPLAGRLFSADELKPGSNGAALISYSFWQTHFGGRNDAIGQPVHMLGHAVTIVGILPPGFHYPDQTDIWFPANTIEPSTTGRGAHNYRVIARLKPGVSLEQAQGQMTAVGARLAQQYPPTNKGTSVAVSRLQDELVSEVRLTLYVLLGAVGAVLLIACANMANLLLAKATARTREVAVRVALGATRTRIVRQLITESLLLALVAGGAGLALAYWASQALVALAPSTLPRATATGIDVVVVGFTLGISVLSSLLFGMAPAMQLTRVDLNEALKQGAARALVGGGAGRMRNALVVAEVAVSVILVCGAGLLIKSFIALNNVDLGFKTENVIVMNSSYPASWLDPKSAQRGTLFYRDLLQRISALPGVSSAAATRTPPGEIGSDGSYWVDHLPPEDQLGVNAPQAVFSVISPEALKTVGISITKGRDFNSSDAFEAPFTAIVNEALARQAFPGKDPIGHTIFCGLDSLKGMTIVGVATDIHQAGPGEPSAPEIYMPYLQHPGPSTDLNVVVRASGEVAGLQQAMERTVRELSPDVPVRFTTLESYVAEDVAAPRFRTLLLGIFAAVALALALAGVYGVMAYMVSQRSTEIGLRMALGATPGSILQLVLGKGLRLALFGLAIGLAGSLALSRVLASMLFAVKATDPLTFIEVSALLLLAALVASYIPARRATKVDPLVAMRYE